MDETKLRAWQTAAKIARMKCALAAIRAGRFAAKAFLEVSFFSPGLAFLAAAGILCGIGWLAQWAFPGLGEPLAWAWSTLKAWNDRHETLSEAAKVSTGLGLLGACLYLEISGKPKAQVRIEEDLKREQERSKAFGEAQAIAQAAPEQELAPRRSGASKRL